MRNFDPPIVINCRDRVTPLRKLVDWLERAGHERILLYDNDSTYEPLLDYFRETPHEVVHLGANLGSRALFLTGVLQDHRDWFVYTDPDIVPIDDCPLDAVALLQHALIDNPDHTKAALGLFRDDVPADMPSHEWERRLLMPRQGDPWRGHIGFVGDTPIFESPTDTTFALYRPGSEFTLRALRTGWPYMARHDCPSWYTDREVTDEERYYFERASSGPEGSSGKERVL